MEREKTAVFLGHSNCDLSIEKISPIIEGEIKNGVKYFLNGGQGTFDRLCARAVYNLKSKYPDIKNTLVIPYSNFKIFDISLFDEIISTNVDYDSNISYKSAIPKRNKYMIENARTAICYINRISGGAYKTYKLAEKSPVGGAKKNRVAKAALFLFVFIISAQLGSKGGNTQPKL